MKFLTAIIILSLLSCRSIQQFKVAPDVKSHKIETKSDFETSWKTILGFCSDNGMTLKVLSKPDGIITAEKPFCKLTYLKSGKIYDSSSWVVAERVKQSGNNNYYNPTRGVVEWIILISTDGAKGTIVRVNLKTPILVTNTKMPGFDEKKRVYKSNAYSTGELEKQIGKLLIP
jgi:hypothetical protein